MIVLNSQIIPEYAEYPESYTNSPIRLALQLTAPELPESDETEPEPRAPLDLVFVIDTSGSMSLYSRLDLVKKSLQFVVEGVLQPRDRIAIVTFSFDAKVRVPLTYCTDANKPTIMRKVNRMGARGGTNLSGGLFEGLELLEADTEQRRALRRVIILTDGDANEGLTDVPSIMAHLQNPPIAPRPRGRTEANPEILNPEESILERLPPFQLHTFGYGEEANATLLNSLASAFEGQYGFIEVTEQIGDQFGGLLGGFTSVVANNVLVHFRVTEDASFTSVSSTYPFEEIEGVHTAKIGSLEAEDTRKFLITLQVPEMTANHLLEFWFSGELLDDDGNFVQCTQPYAQYSLVVTPDATIQPDRRNPLVVEILSFYEGYQAVEMLQRAVAAGDATATSQLVDANPQLQALLQQDESDEDESVPHLAAFENVSFRMQSHRVTSLSAEYQQQRLGGQSKRRSRLKKAARKFIS